MPLTASNVRVARTGGVYFAPAATPIPTDTTTALNVAFVELGYVTEDGITQSMDTETTDIRAWQNGDTVRSLRTAHTVTYQFSLLETSTAVLQAFYGNATASSVNVTGASSPARGRWVVQVVDGTNNIRIVIPDGEVTEWGDVVYANSEPIVYQMTVTCYPDVSGNKAYKYRA